MGNAKQEFIDAVAREVFARMASMGHGEGFMARHAYRQAEALWEAREEFIAQGARGPREPGPLESAVASMPPGAWLNPPAPTLDEQLRGNPTAEGNVRSWADLSETNPLIREREAASSSEVDLPHSPPGPCVDCGNLTSKHYFICSSCVA